MSRYKRYEKYKDSGVEWIGEIPEHWGVKPLKRVFKIINGGTPSSSEESYWNGEIVWVTPNDLSKLTEACIVDSERKITQDGLHNCSARIVPKGSIVISTRAPIGYVAIAGVPLCTNQGCKSLVAINKVNPKYFYYWMHSISFYLNVLGQGTTFIELSNSSLSMVELLTPSINEQNAIVNFLDQKTAEIDDLIADKEKLIELLQEKRQAIITEVITKGLNPNVSMKDSGVEWIGEIPEHWEIIPLKYITNFISRGNSPEYVEESSIKVINQACIYWDELKIENVKYQYDDIDFDKLKGKLIKGDLLLNSTGTGTLGRAVVFREDGNYMADSHVTIIRFNKMKMDEFFAFYILQTQIYQGYIYNALVTGATNQIELSRERLTATPMIVPPSTEQQEIVNFLDAKIGQIAILINEIKLQIQKLKEYRQSLIFEAVTGKIDVRDYVVD